MHDVFDVLRYTCALKESYWLSHAACKSSTKNIAIMHQCFVLFTIVFINN